MAAVQVCELNGGPVNPANGNTTVGMSGLMRCRDGEGGPVVREQELQQGRFMGVVRTFRNGTLEREYRVNERGNRDGPAREWVPAEADRPAGLVREETYRDGSHVGVARSWYPGGPLRRLTAYGDDGRQQASAEFNPSGQLAELHCAPQPALGRDFDDRAACGHDGSTSALVFYGSKGQPRARVAFRHGKRVRSETLGEGGGVRELRETTAGGGIARSFAADGTLRHEVQWQNTAGERARRVTTLDKEFHESGKPVRERRWRVGEGAGELASEAQWYLNGQPRERSDYVEVDGGKRRRSTAFHDNGRMSFEGSWRIEPSGGRELPVGAHRSFDDAGRLRSERVFDERGRVSRERELDEHGTVVRDDEVFEDGSRKAFGR